VELVDGIWYSVKYDARPAPRARALHCVGMNRGERDRRFFSIRRRELGRALRDLGVHAVTPDVCLERWEVHDTESVWGRLAGVLRTCRLHRGRVIAIGATEPVYLFDDVGCTRLVPNGHGREHYWDLVDLSRRQHIADPQVLYLSARASEVLADTPLSEIDFVCDRFDDLFFDLMLSILCARRGLGHGMMLLALPDGS
jgi:hypothetical protein